MRRLALLLALAAAAPAASHAGAAGSCAGSPLAIDLLARADAPELWLAQRVIDREWVVPTDTSYTPPLVGGKSEAGAMLLSSVLPGAGQLYAGEKSGYFFALAEVAGWAGWFFLHRKADDARDEAVVLAGSPGDSTSAWSFQRWQNATTGDPSDLRALYDVDREAFYDAIAGDARYAAGWSSSDTRSRFGDLRDRSDQRLRDAHRTEAVLWLNHLVAAVDGLRAARIHNLPLREGLELKAQGRWRRGGPSVAVALVRRF